MHSCFFYILSQSCLLLSGSHSLSSTRHPVPPRVADISSTGHEITVHRSHMLTTKTSACRRLAFSSLLSCSLSLSSTQHSDPPQPAHLSPTGHENTTNNNCMPTTATGPRRPPLHGPTSITLPADNLFRKNLTDWFYCGSSSFVFDFSSKKYCIDVVCLSWGPLPRLKN
ncbi:hypothetical protein Cgig2_004226 [Carnegiea gigantea]|uniref:Uncharacterized protein n=1 Tax=Carnegiea gigantea TaxID=171969 RepID=A0A9Q1K3S4_9CARY|nr:hypothetical protein Cgig2_004226 [Carnegiea gigantea]